MSGHSKWSKVKHQKAVTDSVKAQIFTKLGHAITITVKEGGGTNPDSNFRLRLAIEKAKAANMPKENINRAIERGGSEGGETLEPILYEAYGPGGVGLIIEGATDNRQRTVSQVKNLLERAGGSLASPGAVSFNFKKSAEMIFQPVTLISPKPEIAAKIESLVSELEELPDVQQVYTNLA